MRSRGLVGLNNHTLLNFTIFIVENELRNYPKTHERSTAQFAHHWLVHKSDHCSHANYSKEIFAGKSPKVFGILICLIRHTGLLVQ